MTSARENSAGASRSLAPGHCARGEAQSFDLSSDDRAAFVALGVFYALFIAWLFACWAVIQFCS